MILTRAMMLHLLAVQLLWWSFHGVECCTTPIVTQVTNPVQLAEAPHWDVETQVLFFVDTRGGLINRYDPSTDKVTHAAFPGSPVSIVIPVNGTNAKQFLVTRGRDVILVNWNYENVTFENSIDDENVSVITTVETGENQTQHRWNDGKADAEGRLWAGTIGPEPIPGDVVLNQAAFYRLDPNSTTPIVEEKPVTNSNGLIWNEDNTLLYYIDSSTYQIDVFDFDLEGGSISNRRKVFNLKENNVPGLPDGMTIDSKGNLWIGCFYGRRIINVNPRTGTLIRSVEIPADQVTSMMFGGPNLDILYVATARLDLTEQQLQNQPLAGSVFAVTCLGVKALAPAHNIVRVET